ncbi:MAG: chitobiase/beta-hexosaminidase C-terminal domain-containing protein [Opitutaceae bacterium]
MPVSIDTSCELSAIAYAIGMSDSPVTSATYIISNRRLAMAPTFTPGGGTYTSAQVVAIHTTSPGAKIAYTTDGSIPTANGFAVTNGTSVPNGSTVGVSTNTTLNAIALVPLTYGLDSPNSAAVYSILGSPLPAPVFNPPTFDGYSPIRVFVTDTEPGVTIRYTTDTSTPTETNGTIYNGDWVVLNFSCVLEAIAYESGYADSAVAIANYPLAEPVRGIAPMFSPLAGTYVGPQTVTLTDYLTDYGGLIVYTTNGTTPAESWGTITNGMVSSGPITINVSTTTTINAFCFGATGFADSGVISNLYTIDLPPPVPTTLRVRGSDSVRRADSLSQPSR